MFGLLLALGGGEARAEGEADPAPPSAARIEALVLDAAPVVDGDLSDWPQPPEGSVATLGRPEQVYPPTRERWEGPEDSSARVIVGVHGETLYLAAWVEDDVAFHPGEPWWHGDALELFLDADHVEGRPRPERYTANCWQIFLMPRNPELAWGVVYRGERLHFDDAGLRGVRVAHRERTGGWDLEAAIPLANFGVAPRAARALGFALALNDADEAPARPGTYLSWNGGFELWQRPDRFGTLLLPDRPRIQQASEPSGSRPGLLPLALALLLGASAAVLLLGPASGWVSRLGTGPKVMGLVLVATLALVYEIDATWTEAGARTGVREQLDILAVQAEEIARDAASLGALSSEDPAERGRRLADLLRGRSVPVALPAEEVAVVALAPPEGAAEAARDGYRLPLDEARVIHLAEPIFASRLVARIQVQASGPAAREAAAPERLGRLGAEGPHGASGPHDLLCSPGATGVQEVAVALGGRGPWTRLLWKPGPKAPRALLRGVVADGEEGPARALLLCRPTEDGVPVLGGPDAPFLGLTLQEGEEASVSIPSLAGANRLWLVLGAKEAFPRRLGDDVVAELLLEHGEGTQRTPASAIARPPASPPTRIELRNGEHLAAERMPLGLHRPPERAARVAWQWRGAYGEVRAHDAIAVPLDPARPPTSLRVRNRGGAGALDVVAATLVRTAPPPPASRLALDDAAHGQDAAFVMRPPPAFAAALGTRAQDAVQVDRLLLDGERPVPIRLAAPLPDAVRAKEARRTVALLTCVALALLLLVLLAVDAVERFHRLTLRLAFGVLAAALVPLGATFLLVDRSTSHRLEAEHAARARAAAASVESAVQEAQRRAQDAATNLAGLLATDRSDEEPGRMARLVRLALPRGGGASTVLVSRAEHPVLRVPSGQAPDALAGPRFLAEHPEAGLHVTPWDGLVLVGNARGGSRRRGVHVTLGVRVDERFLEEELLAALPDPGAPVALLDAEGVPLAAAGEGGPAFLAALARRAGSVRETLASGQEALLPRVREACAGGRTHLAVVSRLEGRGPGAGAWLAVGLDRSPLDVALASQRTELLWLGLFGLLLVATVATLTARRVADPVRGLVRVTEAVRRGEFDVTVPPAGADEVGDLTVAFDQMRLDLRHRMGDLDFLRRAQDALAGSLDLQHRAEGTLDLLGLRFRPDCAVLLDATAPGAPVHVLAERGRRTRLDDRPFQAAAGGWIEAALRADEAVEIVAPQQDERVAREGGLGLRLVEGRLAWIAVPLRFARELTALAVLAWDDPAAVPRGEARRILAPLAGVCALALHNARLYRLAALDDVTRLPGATAFEAALRADVERAVAGGPAVALLRVGLDHMENVVRQRGVEPARALLRALADALRAACGGRGRVGRLRKDELAVRILGASNEEAFAQAEALRERLARVEVLPEEGGEAARTGVTIGLARCPDDATSVEFLLDAAGRALASARSEGGDRVADATRLDAGLVEAPPFEEGAIFRSEPMVRVVDAARRAAHSDASVLVTGETGTGKEVVANLIHRRSARAERPFVKVNCAAFPETLLESELFGHERGAFTGAERRREGRFELADGGTLFLDEIAEMTRSAQVKLLRVLQERQFTRLGGTRPVQVDVRIVAATNRDLEQAVAEGSFREDLYYRLNVIRLEIPPLRARREEIPVLVERFLEDVRRRTGRGPHTLSGAAMDLLYRHPWPGNVRELKNAIERCAVLCDADVAGPEHLRLDGQRTGGQAMGGQGAGGAPTHRAAPLDGLNDRQRRLLDHLARHGRCTNRAYQEMTGTSPRTGLRDLQDLMDRGFLVREGRRRGAVYRLP